MKDRTLKTSIAARSYENGLDDVESALHKYGKSPSLHDLVDSDNLGKARSSQAGDFTLPRKRKNFINNRSQSIEQPAVGRQRNGSSSRVKELGNLGK